MRILRVPKGGFRAMAFSPDGRYLATGHEYGAVCLWDYIKGEIAASQNTPIRGCGTLFFSPDGTHLFAYGSGQSSGEIHHLHLTSLETGGIALNLVADSSLLDSWETSIGFGHPLRVSNDGSTILGAVPHHPYAYRWPLNGEQATIRALDHRNDGIAALAIRHDEQLMATSANKGTAVHLWTNDTAVYHPISRNAHSQDFPLEQPEHLLEHSAHVSTMDFSPDGEYLATLAVRTMHVWNIATKKCLFQVPVSQLQVRSVRFSPTGRTVVTVSNDREVKFWDAQTGEERARFAFQIGRISRIAFSPDGLIAVAGGLTRKLVMWDLEDL